LKKRRIKPIDATEYERTVWRTYQKIKDEGNKSSDRLVYPRRFKMTMTIKTDSDAVPAGEVIRCWMPYPRSFPHQTDMKLVSSSSTVRWLAEPESPSRSVYLEQTAEKDRPTIFQITYTYTVFGVNNIVRADAVLPSNRGKTVYKDYTAEQPPHIVFTDDIKKLSKSIVGSETNPYLKAKKCYDWIVANIQYSYIVEYSTIPNISEYCLKHRYGDCGLEALLFITLCRLNGIPARWQSGWYTMPGGKTIHDWSEIYVEPYGWIPVDPYLGIEVRQIFQTLTETERRELIDFYCGGLDPFRMMANSDHSMTLYPQKRSFRSDNVDFQRAELEYGTTNIYFDKWSFDLQVEPLD
jgi:transglutaminase-like putative cysteine protease